METIQLPPETPVWLQVIVTVFATVLLPFIIRYFRAKETEAAKQSELAIIDANKSLIEQRGVIAERLKRYLWGSAAAIAEREFPIIAQKIISGKLQTKEEIKRQLYQWGTQLRGEALIYFNNQGINLLETFGPQALDDLIERAANAVSPFPGKETATALLKDGVADLLLDKGVDYLRTYTTNKLNEVK